MEIIPKRPQFKLVNYCSLPRCYFPSDPIKQTEPPFLFRVYECGICKAGATFISVNADQAGCWGSPSWQSCGGCLNNMPLFYANIIIPSFFHPCPIIFSSLSHHLFILFLCLIYPSFVSSIVVILILWFSHGFPIICFIHDNLSMFSSLYPIHDPSMIHPLSIFSYEFPSGNSTYL